MQPRGGILTDCGCIGWIWICRAELWKKCIYKSKLTSEINIEVTALLSPITRPSDLLLLIAKPPENYLVTQVRPRRSWSFDCNQIWISKAVTSLINIGAAQICQHILLTIRGSLSIQQFFRDCKNYKWIDLFDRIISIQENNVLLATNSSSMEIVCFPKSPCQSHLWLLYSNAIVSA